MSLRSPTKTSYIAKSPVGCCSRSYSDERMLFAARLPSFTVADFPAKACTSIIVTPRSPQAPTSPENVVTAPGEALPHGPVSDPVVHGPVASFPPINALLSLPFNLI